MIRFSDFRIIYRGGGVAAVLYHMPSSKGPAYLAYRSSTQIAQIMAGYQVCLCEDEKYQPQLRKLRDDVIRNGVVWFHTDQSLYRLLEWEYLFPMPLSKNPSEASRVQEGGVL